MLRLNVPLLQQKNKNWIHMNNTTKKKTKQTITQDSLNQIFTKYYFNKYK